MTDKKEPIFTEILASDLLETGYLPYAYNVNINTLDPSVVWHQLQADPWFAMSVFRDMEAKDDVVASSLRTRRNGVLAKSRRVMPASEKRQDIKIAEFIEETLEGFFDPAGGLYTGLNQVLSELLDAIPKGVAIGEIIYAQSGERVFIKDVKFRPQHLFSFGETALAAYSTASYLAPQSGPLRLRQGFSVNGVGADGRLPDNKFLVGTYYPYQSNRWGSPLLKECFWPSWIKRTDLKLWLRYHEKGPGTVITKYNDSASDDEQQKALDASRAISEEASVAIPKKFTYEIAEHVRQSMGTSYEALVDGYCNNALLRLILGQTLTARGGEGGGGARALGEVHNEVRSEYVEADAKFLISAINQGLVWPLVLFNFGPIARPPIWSIDYEAQKDLSAMSIWLTRLWQMKLKIPTQYVRTVFSVPAPEEEEETLEPPSEGGGGSLPSTGVDPAAEFSEKKTPLNDDAPSSSRSSSKMGRFARLRPSMMPPLEE